MSDIVDVARSDKYVSKVIIFGSSISYKCTIVSDIDICIKWTELCYDNEGVLKPFTRNLLAAITRFTEGNADVMHYDYLDGTLVKNAVVNEGVVVYERDV